MKKENKEEKNKHKTEQDVETSEFLINDLKEYFKQWEASRIVVLRRIYKERLLEYYKHCNFLSPFTEKIIFFNIDKMASMLYKKDILRHEISKYSRKIFLIKLQKLINDYLKDFYSGYFEDDYLERKPGINIDYDTNYREAWGKITIDIFNENKEEEEESD